MKVDAAPTSDKPKIPLPTLSQINADRITQLANQYWSPQTKESHLPYDASIVESIYQAEILGSHFSVRRIMMLEFSQYLENYLWPHYTAGEASQAHMMSIIVMINEKFRERVPAWQAFLKKPDHFPAFFEQVLRASVEDDRSRSNMREQTALLLFLNHCFGSMEVQLCRDQVKRLVSLSMWISLQEGRRNQEFKTVPKWRKYWRAIQKKDKPELLEKLSWERLYLQRLMIKFMRILESIPETGDVDSHAVRYCERFLELMIDLEALLPTRRFFNTVMDDSHLVVRSQMAALTRRPEGQLFSQMQDDAADIHGLTQQSITTVCRRVARAILEIKSDYINMPITLNEQLCVMEDFEAIAGFKNVVGAIDCTHIRVPKVNGPSGQFYINRKGYSSLNVQAVCDARLKIRNIVVRWRGSTHDSRIFNESLLKQSFENSQFFGRLLGDSGYACTPYLFTPLLHPTTSKEESYNFAHIRTRNTIERCFGVWKNRFRCLLTGFRTSLENTKMYIVALAVLHNIAIGLDEEPFPDNDNVNTPEQPPEVRPQGNTLRGASVRATFIEENY